MSESLAPDSWRLIPGSSGVKGVFHDTHRFTIPDASALWEWLEHVGPSRVLYAQVAQCSLTLLHAAQYGPPATFDRPWAYICSPYAPRLGESVAQHVHWAQALARLAYHEGFWPIVPHLYAPQFLDDTDPAERQVGTAWGLSLLTRCVMIYVLDVPPSSGMQCELAAIQPAQCIRPVSVEILPALLRQDALSPGQEAARSPV
jgi:hypothetical protein